MKMPARMRLPAVALVVTAFPPVAFAQSVAAVVPQVVVNTRDAIASATPWPGVDVRVDRDAYVTMFAVARGGRDLPIQVLSPGNPGDKGLLKAGRSYQPRQLSSIELWHLADFGAAPLVIAFASNVKPNLTALADGRRWSNALFVADSAAPNTRELVNALAKEIYGLNVPFSVSVSPTTQPFPSSVLAARAFEPSGGVSAAQCQNTMAAAQRELLSVGIQAGSGIGAAYLVGVPYGLKGGQRVVLQRHATPTGDGCDDYRIAYLPRIDGPMGDQIRTTRRDLDSTRVERPSTPRRTVNGSVTDGRISAPEVRKAPKAQPDAQGAVSAPFEPSRRKAEPKTDSKTDSKVERKDLPTEPVKTPRGAF